MLIEYRNGLIEMPPLLRLLGRRRTVHAGRNEKNPGLGCVGRSVTRGLVGVRGFEPPASTSRTWRANQAALHPVAGSDSIPRASVLPRALPLLRVLLVLRRRPPSA